MSSLRNSLHRRNHKERSQLSHRQRFGILEKHKDYVLRARDYHSKQDRIQRLRQKAAERNKDEFYFAMNRQRTEVYVFLNCTVAWVLTLRTCVGRRACAGSRECQSSGGYGQNLEDPGRELCQDDARSWSKGAPRVLPSPNATSYSAMI